MPQARYSPKTESLQQLFLSTHVCNSLTLFLSFFLSFCLSFILSFSLSLFPSRSLSQTVSQSHTHSLLLFTSLCFLQRFITLSVLCLFLSPSPCLYLCLSFSFASSPSLSFTPALSLSFFYARVDTDRLASCLFRNSTRSPRKSTDTYRHHNVAQNPRLPCPCSCWSYFRIIILD